MDVGPVGGAVRAWLLGWPATDEAEGTSSVSGSGPLKYGNVEVRNFEPIAVN